MTIFDGIMLFYVLPCLVTILIAIQYLRTDRSRPVPLWQPDEWEDIFLAGVLYPIVWVKLGAYLAVSLAKALSQTEIPWMFWRKTPKDLSGDDNG